MIDIKLTKQADNNTPTLFIINNKAQIKDLNLSKEQVAYLEKFFTDKKDLAEIKSLTKTDFVVLSNSKKKDYNDYEKLRKHGNKIYSTLNENKHKLVTIVDNAEKEKSLAVLEGFYLSSYRFNKYFKDKKAKSNHIQSIHLLSDAIEKPDVLRLQSACYGVFKARDIVNEPLSYMTAVRLSEYIREIGKDCGYTTEIFDKKRIESLKMGGILAVNRGSVDPPTFSILNWSPENAINKKPYILVGKGLVYDTGGINLKPGSGLNTMKSDKAGAASVIGALAAISKAKLPINVIGLIPATDNRPGENAYVPQDIIKMYDGTTVEVMNTDAEGRMILADALAYAKKYKPELVIDLATLTGAAVVAIGENASAVMGNDSKNIDRITKSGFNTYERLVELPLWDDYKEQLKSDFADINNIGGPWAGAITAGKFLEHFTDYKWMHIDIAGPSYVEKPKSYHGVGGSGVGVRLLMDFFVELLKK